MRWRLLFIFFACLVCLTHLNANDIYKIDDGYLVGAGFTSDNKALMVDIYFSFECRFDKGSNSVLQQKIHAEDVADYLMIEIRNYINDVFFPKYRLEYLLEIISAEQNLEFYNGFLEYITGKKEFCNVLVTRITMKAM
jgi:hypothetical protein